MKTTVAIIALASLTFGSCADKKENREEFKEEHNKDFMRNNMGETAASNSEQSPYPDTDTPKALRDTAASATDYKSKESRPNTSVGGSR
ncbi:hypothetical protein [Chryseobacterium binzhouense]|uniref:hypothetical protein n=1 Tax=Chryseobacterium binzhouense TaxID=2593646 RepID=UPI001180C161|nr:hypothetical protein [Chryseobacterium binzhouense]